MPAGEHWLQLIHTNVLDTDHYTPQATWPDPSGDGSFWLIDNQNTPGQPFYDLVPNSPAILPNFGDAPSLPWNGTSFVAVHGLAQDRRWLEPFFRGLIV